MFFRETQNNLHFRTKTNTFQLSARTECSCQSVIHSGAERNFKGMYFFLNSAQTDLMIHRCDWQYSIKSIGLWAEVHRFWDAFSRNRTAKTGTEEKLHQSWVDKRWNNKMINISTQTQSTLYVWTIRILFMIDKYSVSLGSSRVPYRVHFNTA